MLSVQQTPPIRKPLTNLNQSRAFGSPLRKSLLAGSTSVVKVTKNNDEEERLHRRNNAEIQRRMSSISVANRSSINDNSELSNSKMQDHFQTCVRMFSENKINAKNAWNLKIIEFMRRLLDVEDFSSGDSLQLASTSLDISSKVYGIRVDDIHQDILKLATTMARINMDADQHRDDEVEDAPGDNNDSNSEEEGEAQKEKEKKRKKRNSMSDENSASQLATNSQSLVEDFEIHNTEYNLDSSGKKRLYTLTAARAQIATCELRVNSSSTVSYWSATAEPPAVRPTSELLTIPVAELNGPLCPSFNDFVIDEWEPDSEEWLNQSQRAEGVVYDDDGFPIPELDQSLQPPEPVDDNHDNFSDIEEEFGAEAHAAGTRPELAHVSDMRPGTTTVGSVADGLEYSYRAPPIVSERYLLTGVWAGPAHWKVKCLQPRQSGASKAAQHAKGTRKRAPKAVAVPIDFNMTDEDFERLIAHDRKVKLIKPMFMNNDKLTLPPDLGVTARDFVSLFLRPQLVVGQRPHASKRGNHLDLNITNYEYDNPNDAEYCNETILDDAENGGDGAAGEDGVGEEANVSFMDENMVNMPHMVAKIPVTYATQAKKMDMKKLKEAIFRTVVKQDRRNADVNDNEIEEHSNKYKFSGVSFCKMYESLPNQLNSRMVDELSCPLAFVGLLHLCNERSLQLKGQDDLLDVLISTK